MARSDFAGDIAAFAAHTGKTIEQTCRAVKISILKDAVMNTRVDTGRLRGNWVVSNGTPTTETTEDVDPNGGKTINKGTANIQAIGETFICNNLPYAAVIDEKDAIVASVLARMDRNIKDAVAGAKK